MRDEALINQKTEFLRNVSVQQNRQKFTYNGTTLPARAFEEIDTAVEKAIGPERELMNMFIDNNLLLTDINPGKTMLTRYVEKPGADATTAMKYGENLNKDKSKYESVVYPLPIIHKATTLNLRDKQAGSSVGFDVQASNIETNARKIYKKAESVIAGGDSSIVVGSDSLYGITNVSWALDASCSGSWASSPANIQKDVAALIGEMAKNGYSNNLVLAVSYDDYAAMLQTDSNSRTYLSLVKEYAQINDVIGSSNISTGDPHMIEASPRTIQLAVPRMIQTPVFDKDYGIEAYTHMIMAPIVKKALKEGTKSTYITGICRAS